MAQHLADMFFFSVILAGPASFSCVLVLAARRERKTRGLGHDALLFLVSWCLIQTLVCLALGLCRQLNVRTIIFIDLLLFITGVILIRYRQREAFRVLLKDLKKWKGGFSLREKLLLTALLSVCLYMLWNFSITPISEYDSLAYHLPAMATWFQTGAFPIPDQFLDKQIGRYPYHWEVLCTALLFPFREDFLVAFPNIMAWLIMGLSVYLLGIMAGASRLPGLACMALVMTVPIVIENVNTMHVDLAFAALMLAALYMMLIFHRTRSRLYFLLFFASLGMLAGIKTSGLLYGLLLLIIFSVLEVKHFAARRKQMSDDRGSHVYSAAAVAAGIFIFFVPGGFWYLRNWIALGNPLGHTMVQIGHISIFPGKIHPETIFKTSLAYVFDPANAQHWSILIHQVKDQLHFSFLVIFLLTLLYCFTLLSDSLVKRKRETVLPIILLIVTAILYCITPYSGDNGRNQYQMTRWVGQGFRYGFPLLGICGICASVAATRMSRRLVGGLMIFALASCLIIVARNPWLFGGTVALLAVVLAGTLMRKNEADGRFPERYSFLLRASGVFFLVVVVAAGTYFARYRRDENRDRVYNGITRFMEHHLEKHDCIGYFSSHKSYLFYGRSLDQCVKYIPPPRTLELSRWLEVLKREGITVVAVGPQIDPHPPPAYSWLQDAGGPFTHVFGRDFAREPELYRFHGMNDPGRNTEDP